MRAIDTDQRHVCMLRVGHKKAEDIETLFQLYDMLEASCQETLKGGSTVPSKDTAAASQLLDELRIRFVRLVCALLFLFEIYHIFSVPHRAFPQLA